MLTTHISLGSLLLPTNFFFVTGTPPNKLALNPRDDCRRKFRREGFFCSFIHDTFRNFYNKCARVVKTTELLFILKKGVVLKLSISWEDINENNKSLPRSQEL